MPVIPLPPLKTTLPALLTAVCGVMMFTGSTLAQDFVPEGEGWQRVGPRSRVAPPEGVTIIRPLRSPAARVTPPQRGPRLVAPVRRRYAGQYSYRADRRPGPFRQYYRIPPTARGIRPYAGIFPYVVYDDDQGEWDVIQPGSYQPTYIPGLFDE